MLLTGNDSYGLALVCLDDLPAALFSDLVGGTLPRGEFRATFSFDPATVYTFLEIDPNFYGAFSESLDGLDGLFIALGFMVSFDEEVAMTIVSGAAPRELLRAPGGMGFIAAYDNLPCAAE